MSLACRFTLIGLCLTLTGKAVAHAGFENSTEVRLLPDQMKVVVRTSLPFAWTLLGPQAPAQADAAGKARAAPLLAEAGRELFQCSAGGQPLLPLKSECLFEVHDDAAFILQYPLPTRFPVRLEARFFPRFGQLDSGTIAVFDSRASRFARDLPPLLEQVLDAAHPFISFDPTQPAAPVNPATPVPPPAAPSPESTTATTTPPWWPALFLAMLLLLAGGVALRSRRHRGKP